MASDGIAEFLRRLVLRSPLSAEEQRAVMHLSGQRRVIDTRRDIVTPGRNVEHACLVVTGLAGRFDLDTEGRRQITAFYLPGDMCDLHSLPSPHTGWGICALVPMTILRIPHAQLRALVSRYNTLALALWRDSVVDASILAKWLAIFAHKPRRLASRTCYAKWALEWKLSGWEPKPILSSRQLKSNWSTRWGSRPFI